MFIFYIFSCATIENGGGIYKYLFDGKQLFQEKYFPCDRPMFGIYSHDKILVLLREVFSNGNSGFFTLDSDLNNASPVYDTLGKCSPHLCAINEKVYFCNYLSGNIGTNFNKTVNFFGSGVNKKRQEMSHPHYICPDFDGNNLICCDLGLDSLYVFDKQLNILSEVKVPSGYGVRHFSFSKNGKFLYAINELVPSISVFSYSKGQLNYLSSLILSLNKNSTGAAIKISRDGNFLYATVRGENNIYVLSVDDDKIEIKQIFQSNGDEPRDIGLLEDNYIVCCNQFSDNFTVFSLNEGLVEKKVVEKSIKGALCCLTL